ncbi:MAG: NAD-dependent epimerase/dehydratase family protein [Candidatus Hydrogenedens sp.]|nr:NAD-dependent epimerase/dehydratase family protein [Candidatus Hydrogenedens sp.]
MNPIFNRANLAFCHDLAMTGLGFVLSMYLRTSEFFLPNYWDVTVNGLLVILPISIVVYRFLGLYRGIWRYASLQDLLQLTKAVTTVTLAFILAMFLFNRLHTVPRSLPVILWFVLMILLGGPRFVYRLLRDSRKAARFSGGAGAGERVPVLLFGVGDGAELFIRAITNDPYSAYRVVGVLDEKGRRVGRAIHGVPVLGHIDDLDAVVAGLVARKIQPQRLILTQGNGEIDGALVRQLVDQTARLGLTLGRLPSLTEFKEAVSEGKIELRPIAIQDLLGRPQAVLNREAIRTLVAGRRVLITGAGGTIGGELSRQLATLGPTRLILLDNSEFNLYAIDMELGERHAGLDRERLLCDVRDRDQLMRIFDSRRPDLVFHAAALKHVPLVEENLTQGALTNAIGTRNVADACRSAGTIAMVLISTDKAIRPSSVMGATKRFAEAYVQSLDVRSPTGGDSPELATRFMTVRFGNVLGSSGSVVPLFQRQLSRGGPITVTHPEMRRYFMTVEEAVQLVLQASAYGVANRSQRGKIFVLDMGEPVRIVDLARQMIRLAGLRPEADVRIEFTGLRPGEKLFEELLSAEEAPTHAEADGIFIASPRLIDYGLMNRASQELETAARAGDEQRASTILHNIVPDFRSVAADTASRA